MLNEIKYAFISFHSISIHRMHAWRILCARAGELQVQLHKSTTTQMKRIFSDKECMCDARRKKNVKYFRFSFTSFFFIQFYHTHPWHHTYVSICTFCFRIFFFLFCRSRSMQSIMVSIFVGLFAFASSSSSSVSRPMPDLFLRLRRCIQSLR